MGKVITLTARIHSEASVGTVLTWAVTPASSRRWSRPSADGPRYAQIRTAPERRWSPILTVAPIPPAWGRRVPAWSRPLRG
jgi:hypothetical protein